MKYHNWQSHGADPGEPYNKKSPNLLALLAYLVAAFGGVSLGLYVVRFVRGGKVWSTHAYGAALDWGYGTDRAMALKAIDFMIANHEALGVQMIVDEDYDRTWKCWRTELNGPGWKAGKVTGGGNWLHIETTPDKWADKTPIAGRLQPTPPPTPTPPTEPTPPSTEDDTMRLIQPFDDIAVLIQDGLSCTWAQDGNVAAALVAAKLVPAEVTVIERIGLKGLVLVGPAPTEAAYAGAKRPGRTVSTDFAAHRPA